MRGGAQGSRGHATNILHKMSAILRASGDQFDVDSFAKESSLTIYKIYRVGDPVRPTVEPEGRKRESSGLSVVVSEVDFDDYEQQFKEAFFLCATTLRS